MNSQGRKPLEMQQTHTRALEGRNILSVDLLPLRGFDVPVFTAPLAIDFRPYRATP